MSEYDFDKFAVNVSVVRHIQARIEQVRAECPTFDDRKFAENLFLLSLNLMGRANPFEQDAPERVAHSVRAYLTLLPELCAPGVDFLPQKPSDAP